MINIGSSYFDVHRILIDKKPIVYIIMTTLVLWVEFIGGNIITEVVNFLKIHCKL